MALRVTLTISRGVWKDQSSATNVLNVGQNMDGPLHATLVVGAASDRLQFEKLVLD